MKSHVLVLISCLLTFTRSSLASFPFWSQRLEEPMQEANNQEMKFLAAKWITDVLRTRVLAQAHTAARATRNTKTPLLPIDLEDSIKLPYFEVDLGKFGPEGFSGNFSLSDGVFRGLSTIKDNFDVDYIRLKISYDITAAELSLEGLYFVDATVTNTPENVYFDFDGEGGLSFSLKKPFINTAITFKIIDLIAGEFELTAVNIDVGFESLTLDLEDFEVCGTVVDWESFNEQAKQIFDQLWEDELKDEVEQVVMDLLNYILKEVCNLTLHDLIYRNGTCEMETGTSAESNTVTSEDTALPFFKAGLQTVIYQLGPLMTCGHDPGYAETQSASGIVVALSAGLAFIVARRA